MARAPLNRAAIVNPASSRAMRRGKLERIALVVPGGRRGNHQPFATPFCSCILFLEALRLSIIPNRPPPPPPPPSFFFLRLELSGFFRSTVSRRQRSPMLLIRRFLFIADVSFSPHSLSPSFGLTALPVGSRFSRWSFSSLLVLGEGLFRI